MHRRLGWLIVAALATTARAEPPAAAPASGADPLPPETAGDAKPKVVAAAAPSPVLDAGNLRTLTDDPVVGKANRIDGDERKGVVAFTFDDGPNPETTPQVIAALEKYDIPATFFIVTQRIAGKHGEKARELLQRELAGGFLVGSHSVTHVNLKHASGDQLAREIDASIRTLAAEAHRPIGMFRP